MSETNHTTLTPARFRLKRKVGYEADDSIEEEGNLRMIAKLKLDKDVSMEKVNEG
jgi:hypothetical protein